VAWLRILVGLLLLPLNVGLLTSTFQLHCWGAVDAATGGKTGINFLGYKNEIGVFNLPRTVLIYTDFFKTLDLENIRSGFAEMIKHALIYSKEEWRKVSTFDLEKVNFDVLRTLVESNIRVKEWVVKQDPTEPKYTQGVEFRTYFRTCF